MAHQLCLAGHQVAVWNRTPAKAEPLRAAGARLADSPSDALEGSEAVFLMLSDAPAIDAVLFGSPEGPDLQGRTVVQMGTIGSGQSQELMQHVHARGGEYVEAPVLGSVPQAEARQLIVMAGCTPEQFARWHELLRCFGENVLRVGPVGQAAALKLALNQLIASLTATFSLSLGFVRRSGIDTSLFMDILRKSALYAPTFDKKLSNMQARDFASANFPTRHLLKDVLLMEEEAHERGLETATLVAIQKILRRAMELGHANGDYSALYDAVDPP
jgi:3-hydroxyisobutyrate dehydrogenase-like beta-hydroxyacid dehydrogenase